MITTITAFTAEELKRRIEDSKYNKRLTFINQGVHKTVDKETHWARFRVVKETKNEHVL